MIYVHECAIIMISGALIVCATYIVGEVFVNVKPQQ